MAIEKGFWTVCLPTTITNMKVCRPFGRAGFSIIGRKVVATALKYPAHTIAASDVDLILVGDRARMGPLLKFNQSQRQAFTQMPSCAQVRSFTSNRSMALFLSSKVFR